MAGGAETPHVVAVPAIAWLRLRTEARPDLGRGLI